MGMLINHARMTRISGVGSHDLKVTHVVTEKHITEILPSGCWFNQKVLLLGGGPSMEGLNPDQLPPYLKIGINKTFVSYPVNINYSMDKRFFDELTYPQKADPRNPALREKWSAFAGIKVFLRTNRQEKFGPSVFLVEDIGQKVVSYDLSVGIYGGKNSGFGALMLAMALGCAKIGLLGYDMKVDTIRKRTHWHGGYWHQATKPIDEELSSMQIKLNAFREEFEEFADTIKSHGISVYNLNKNSALNCFPKMSMDEFIRV